VHADHGRAVPDGGGSLVVGGWTQAVDGAVRAEFAKRDTRPASRAAIVGRPWVDVQGRLGAPWLGTLDDPAATLAGRGWQATLTQPGEPGAHYGRWPYPVLAPGLPGAPRDWFVTARRR
jgi:hypothetical protein